jgi:hypothetical protein
MQQAQFLNSDGATAAPDPAMLGGWLPSLQQMSAALQFRVAQAIGPDPANAKFHPGVHTSMRQGLGMLVLVGLVAGLLDFLVNWISAARIGTALPLAQLSTVLTGWEDSPSTIFPNAAGAASAAQVLAGLEPKAPAWIAAGLSSLGAWISLPLQLMAIWITYGLFVLLVARLLGATPTLTLQRFYAATGYAFLPLMLTMLAPLACVGTIAGLAAWLWSFLLYVATVRFVAGVDTGRAVVAVLTPAAVFLLAWLLLLSFGFAAGVLLVF